jgi:hypothetical protein
VNITKKEDKNSLVKELETLIKEVHEHLDDEMEELFQTLHEEFLNLSTQIGVLQRLEKLEKKMSELDTYSKRFQS